MSDKSFDTEYLDAIDKFYEKYALSTEILNRYKGSLEDFGITEMLEAAAAIERELGVSPLMFSVVVEAILNLNCSHEERISRLIDTCCVASMMGRQQLEATYGSNAL